MARSGADTVFRSVLTQHQVHGTIKLCSVFPRTSTSCSARRTFCSLQQPRRREFVSRSVVLLRNAATGIAAAVLLGVASVAAAPAFLSWQRGLNAVIWIANQAIPGSISVSKASLGWNRPVLVSGIGLEDVHGESLLSIQEISTKATLWSIVRGKSGLGECSIGPLRVNLLEDDATGFPRLSLALQSLKKLSKTSRVRTKARASQETAVTSVKVSCDVKSVQGGLHVHDGELLVPADAAAALGRKVHVEVLLGNIASDDNQLLQTTSNLTPLQATMWSECAQAELAGFANMGTMKVELVKPIKIQMDLTPELGRLYLSRVNPLLGYIAGPAVAEEDMPDVTLSVWPKDMSLPADEYELRFQPMKVVLAKGPLVEGLLSLLSRGDAAAGQSTIEMETSTIQAVADTGSGLVTCSRADLLIGGKLHVATWGEVDRVDEKMSMIVAIPGSTLKRMLGLKRQLPDRYNLQISVKGTFDRPRLDLRSAGIAIARLAFPSGLLEAAFSRKDEQAAAVPEPVDESFPWERQRQHLGP